MVGLTARRIESGAAQPEEPRKTLILCLPQKAQCVAFSSPGTADRVCRTSSINGRFQQQDFKCFIPGPCPENNLHRNTDGFQLSALKKKQSK